MPDKTIGIRRFEWVITVGSITDVYISEIWMIIIDLNIAVSWVDFIARIYLGMELLVPLCILYCRALTWRSVPWLGLIPNLACSRLLPSSVHVGTWTLHTMYAVVAYMWIHVHWHVVHVSCWWCDLERFIAVGAILIYFVDRDWCVWGEQIQGYFVVISWYWCLVGNNKLNS